jgi:hypothetical protein
LALFRQRSHRLVEAEEEAMVAAVAAGFMVVEAEDSTAAVVASMAEAEAFTAGDSAVVASAAPDLALA